MVGLLVATLATSTVKQVPALLRRSRNRAMKRGLVEGTPLRGARARSVTPVTIRCVSGGGPDLAGPRKGRLPPRRRP